jgi:hypothetical protein
MPFLWHTRYSVVLPLDHGPGKKEVENNKKAIRLNRELREEEQSWQEFALASALRDMEEADEEIYTVDDLKENF